MLNGTTPLDTDSVIQSQEVTSDSNPPEEVLNPTAPPTVTIDTTTDTPISNRTRSTGRSEGLSIKQVSYDFEPSSTGRQATIIYIFFFSIFLLSQVMMMMMMMMTTAKE